MKYNIPIFLTILRVILIPFFVLAFYLPIPSAPFITTLIFFIAGVTDWFDGYLARKLKQTTRFGAFLDPVADKVMVITALVLIVEYQHSFWITIPAIIMISREIIISALREWMAELGERNKVAVSWLGKVKTTSQMLALGGPNSSAFSPPAAFSMISSVSRITFMAQGGTDSSLYWSFTNTKAVS